MDTLLIICILGGCTALLREFPFFRERFDYILAAANTFFLVICYNADALIFLAAFLLLSYAITAVKAYFPKSSFPALLTLIIGLFCVFKNYSILPLGGLHNSIPEVMGLSYIVFRVINLLFEVNQTNSFIPPVRFLNYNLSIFTLLSGPIQRYKNFDLDMAGMKDDILNEERILSALNRSANGGIKVALLAPMARQFQDALLEAGKTETVTAVLGPLGDPVGFLTASLAYMVFLYLNFSGYTDIIIGLARLSGFHLPENFKTPFKCTNFLDFWNHWHISLSSWFRDYCYTPILKSIIRKGATSAIMTPIIPLFISFGLLGVWHGRTWPFLFCGMMLAMGATINNLFRRVMLQQAGPWYKKVSASSAFGALSSAMTFLYISIAIIGLWLSGKQMTAIAGNIAPLDLAKGACLVVLSLGTVVFAVRKIKQNNYCSKALEFLVGIFRDRSSCLIISMKILLLFLCFFIISDQLPNFVYQAL